MTSPDSALFGTAGLKVEISGSASDNEELASVFVYLTEIPLEKIKMFWVSESPLTQQFSLYSQDSIGAVHLEKNIGQGVTGFAIDSRAAAILHCSSPESKFFVSDANDPINLIWQAGVNNGSMAASFSSITIEGGRYHAGLQIPPFLISWHSNGTGSGSYPSLSLITNCDCISAKSHHGSATTHRL